MLHNTELSTSVPSTTSGQTSDYNDPDTASIGCN